MSEYNKLIDLNGLTAYNNKASEQLIELSDALQSDISTAIENHTHKYASSSTVGGAANTAVKLDTPRTISLKNGASGTATSFDGSEDISIPVTSIAPDYISDGYTTKAFYLNTHPDNNGAIIPFVNNDIAFLTMRGGSVIVKYDDVVQNTDISAVFSGAPNFWYLTVSNTGVSTVTIELTLPSSVGWTSTIYIDNGSSNCRAKDIIIEVMNTNFADDTWTEKGSVTDHPYNQYMVKCSHKPVGSTTAANGFNKIRLTFSNFASSRFKISCIGVLKYNSTGMQETFVSRGGCSGIYGNLTPYSNNSVSLGTSAKRWSNVYAGTVNAQTFRGATATTSAAGLMSSDDKTRLDGLESTIKRMMREFYKNSADIYNAENWTCTTNITFAEHDDYVSFTGPNKLMNRLMRDVPPVTTPADGTQCAIAKITLRSVGNDLTVIFSGNTNFPSSYVISTNSQYIGDQVQDVLTDGQWTNIWVVVGNCDSTISKLIVTPVTNSNFEIQIKEISVEAFKNINK